MKMLNASDTRERLGGICYNTMQALIDRGVLKKPRKHGGRLYFLESDVNAAIKTLMGVEHAT